MKKLILASQSPRRRELLDLIGLEYEVLVSRVSEETEQTKPEELVKELAERKARAVYSLRQDAVVLGADTIVALGDRIFGKPKDEEDAFNMIKTLQNNVHQVYTGCAIVYSRADGTEQKTVKAEKTDVRIGAISDDEIRAYIATGEPMDKAGAYAIQGRFAEYIEGIDGDYYNVVGLPLHLLSCELKEIRD